MILLLALGLPAPRQSREPSRKDAACAKHQSRDIKVIGRPADPHPHSDPPSLSLPLPPSPSLPPAAS
eukprot:12757619-Prorocentrum_lima.AAC.1